MLFIIIWIKLNTIIDFIALGSDPGYYILNPVRF